MRFVKSLVAISAFSLAILVLPSLTSAQWYPNNGPGYGNGQYRDIKSTARSLKQRSRDFEKQVDRMVDNRSRVNNDLKQWAGDFRRAADKFESKYGNGRNLNNSADAARDLLDAASRLDRGLRSVRVNNLMGQWNSIQYEVGLVADTYGFRYNNRNVNNRNGGNNRNNGPIFNGHFPWPY